MADLKINVKVDGEEQINKLSKDTEKLSTKTVALGNIYANLAGVAVESLQAMISAGAEHNRTIEEMNGVLTTTRELEQGLSDAFGASIGSLLEYTGVWSAYRTVLETTTDALKLLRSEEAILRDARAKIRDEEAQWAIDDEKRAKAREARRKKEHEAEMRRKKEAYDADVRQQKNLSRIEALVAKEKEEAKRKQEAYNATIKTYNELTEEQVNKLELAELGLSEYGDELLNVKQKTEEHTKTIEVNTQSVEVNTQAIVTNTQALDAQGVGRASTDASSQQGHLAGNGARGTSSQPTVSGAEAYMYATGMMQNPYTRQAERDIKYLEANTKELRKLNRKLK